jgi:protoporphyrinogen oxidase
MDNKNYYDIVIIGSGMAGLYSAYHITQTNPNIKIAILEKFKKQWLGGRTSNDLFYGTQIATGAGIGRLDTNPLLINLMDHLGIPYSKTKAIIDYSKTINNVVDIVKIIDKLKIEYK